MSDFVPPSRWRDYVRPVVLSLCGAGVLAVAGWLVWRAPQDDLAPPRNPTVPAAAPAAATPPPLAPAPTVQAGPSFDIVRIAPNGDAVMAGRAPPGAEVVIREAAAEIGRTRADAAGQWAFVTPQPLGPGARELRLRAILRDGRTLDGDTPVLIMVPERAPPPVAGAAIAAAPAAPALLLPPNAAPRLLQAGPAAAAKLGLDVLDYDDQGDVRFAGSAPVGATVDVYVDRRKVGDALSDAQGRWTLTPQTTMPPGDHALRIEQRGPDGKIIAQVSLPFQRAALAAKGDAARYIVQPHQNLWRIAREVYGQGRRYTVIFDRNRDQIRNQDRIFPGQVLVVPPTRPAAP